MRLRKTRTTEISYYKDIAKLTRFTIQKPGSDPVGCTVTITVEQAHLGKGFVAFFKCPKCLRKARNLYYIGLELGCRICLHLTYRKQDRRKSILNRLIWDDNLREQYYASWRTKHVRMALEAEWAREAIMEEGYNRGKEILKKLQISQ